MLWEHRNQILDPQDVTEHVLRNWQSVVQVQLYMLEVENHHLSTSDASDTRNVWNNWVNIYDKLSLIAQDILAAPASQAYVERGFSVWGLLTDGRRNTMTKSLQMRACLKLNKKVLANTGINASVWTLEL